MGDYKSGSIPGSPRRTAELVEPNGIDPFDKAFAQACEKMIIDDGTIDDFIDRFDNGKLTLRHLYRLFLVPNNASPWSDLKRLAKEFLLNHSLFKDFLAHISQRDKWASRPAFKNSTDGVIWFSNVVANFSGQTFSTPFTASGKDEGESEYHAALSFLEHYFSRTLVPADQTKNPKIENIQSEIDTSVSDALKDYLNKNIER